MLLVVAPALACGVALEPPAGAAAQAPIQRVPEDPPPQELAIGEGVVRLAGGWAGTLIPVEVTEEDALSLTVVVHGVAARIFLYQATGPDGAVLYARDPEAITNDVDDGAEGALVVRLPMSPPAPMEVGVYELVVFTDAPEELDATVTAIVKRGPARENVRLDVVYHFVDAEMGASEAATDADFARAHATLVRLMGLAGITVAGVHFQDLEAEGLGALGSLWGPDSELTELLARTPEERAAHVYFVSELFNEDGTFGVGGIAGGIPGAGPVGGLRSSAAAVGLYDALRSEPELLGLVTAHEILHLLGLFHTTESFLEWYGVDPIADTAACPPERDIDGDQFLDSTECADLGGTNLMFQDAHWENAEVTAGQRQVVALSPLTY